MVGDRGMGERAINDHFLDEKTKDEKKDPDEKMEQDPYFRQVDPDKEHQMYKDALRRLERKHRDKVAKVSG